MNANSRSFIDQSFSMLLHTYSPQPVVMDRGEGVYAWDTDGKKYLDCAAGIAVASLGHAHPEILKTINEQAGKMMACQASYATEPKFKAAQLLTGHTCFDQIYFSNSGTESVEAALKTARKWAYDHKSEEAHEIITFRESFHGRTMGSASITEKRLSQPYFGPYLPGIHYAEFNNLDSVKNLISQKTAAIIVEPVQGEGGLTPAEPRFLMGLRQLCDTEDICLIFDEVQAGMGRLGTFNAYEAFECCPDCTDGGPVRSENIQIIEPDIACWAKGMGSGFPVGGIGVKAKFGEVMVPGTHGTTYGGNPLATAVAHTVMSEILKPGFLENVREMSRFFHEGLEEIKRASNTITDIRGKGLMVGVDTVYNIKKLIAALQDNGLMTTQAGKQTLRLTPPLIITKDEAQEALDILAKTLQEME